VDAALYTYSTCASMTGRICGAAGLVGRRGVLGVKVLACATAKLRKAGRNEWSNGSVSVYCNRSECIGILIGLAVMERVCCCGLLLVAGFCGPCSCSSGLEV
jgi:hypothetical protein